METARKKKSKNKDNFREQESEERTERMDLGYAYYWASEKGKELVGDTKRKPSKTASEHKYWVEAAKGPRGPKVAKPLKRKGVKRNQSIW